MHLCAELPLPSDLSPDGVLTEVRNRRLPKVYTPTQTTETAQPRWPVVAWKALTKPKTAKRQEQRALEKTQPSKIKVEEGEEAGPDAGLEPRVVTDFRATSASRARAQ